ncbi:NADH:flavin oxidoreductase/NADH oxidase [Kaistia dalseonensis]|uniref:2,4-dienoyl-CoA reductase-like NADH-dependent reductase (Old Yellow Enzyme family) n=1 Tax=Kaistia dalseonensis TaxID=410840 RepID=A0ABU0HB31_9HYPH|nr:NADH:flavin oxidoreductase/NADH oxidase [Kaistia dalseonensis]MCX5496457.1 NADH:flavin oxidoreductase/NADH oxidase [Kaistia dalseonensis]MDQ0439078.1 2,4-dienoyl-CoA reductase-like NADH-dependent reductase (Old Yellow Enzyme family) [Kaistia dalseonensis]
MSELFSPLVVGPVTLPNRIAIAPMCMYSSDDGTPGEWHFHHWMSLAASGASMITFEATGVERRGRISHGCLGLYSDQNEAMIGEKLAAARRVAAPGTVFGIQLGHAGRKASSQLPWHGGGALKADQDPWQTVGPSAIPFGPGWHTPTALDEAGIETVIAAFASAARRAARAGLDFVELHGAHGYLLHQFLSPISNKRTDRWGGSLENRMRLILEVAKAVRAALPERVFVGARLSATDWTEGGFTPEEAIIVASALKEAGVVYICASTGGNVHDAKIPVGPLYQTAFATEIKNGAQIVTRAVGLITTPAEAEAIIAEGKADMVALARAVLADPRWPWRAAYTLGAQAYAPPQYQRSLSTMKHWVADAA